MNTCLGLEDLRQPQPPNLDSLGILISQITKAGEREDSSGQSDISLHFNNLINITAVMGGLKGGSC